MNNTTICALATARLNCAIHIIRISGPKAFEIINKISKKQITKIGFKIWRSTIIDNDHVIDDVLINSFVAPNSYTGEDTIEINCHGGVLVADTIISLLIKHGATMAERGEFSKRSMLNKKIDISQVEAINNLIHAKNQLTIQTSINALMGKISDKISTLRSELFKLIGNIEVNIDYPEYKDIEEITVDKAIKTTKKLINAFEKILINSERFIPINNGINVLILGAPNSGKSTLLNALTKSEKAIVSDIPGTTRDVIEACISIDNITLNLFDTAGIRQTTDEIEKLGIDKAKSYLDKSDIVLILKPFHEINKTWFDEYKQLIHDKKYLIVYTKSDLTSNHNFKLNNNEVIISAKKNDLEQLIKKIKEIFEIQEFIYSDMNALQSNRQINILKQVVQFLKIALEQIKIIPIDLVIENYNNALEGINKILGLDKEYDFLNELFANFCLGK